ncbi:MAG: 16S rRNA (guanine(527)-N(7))-methyltransferase RsmG [Bacteroidales bacterium]|nr:16S rRNA (guanine(527)-N(7))-methyltransferase RsmG [Bacteroidales bacterium]
MNQNRQQVVSENIIRYFPSLTDLQKEQFSKIKPVYDNWNSMINVVSRKDMDNFMVHHVLHSLAIAKKFNFQRGTRILDVGTGGGFPGIPLAILFPDCQFTLLDSIEKKIKVVSAAADELGLKNVIPLRKRVEEEKNRYQFIISRAVTEFSSFVKLTEKNLERSGKNSLKNGIIYLKGGDLNEELNPFKNRVTIWNISDFFDEQFFETKKIVYLPF